MREGAEHRTPSPAYVREPDDVELRRDDGAARCNPMGETSDRDCSIELAVLLVM